MNDNNRTYFDFDHITLDDITITVNSDATSSTFDATTFYNLDYKYSTGSFEEWLYSLPENPTIREDYNRIIRENPALDGEEKTIYLQRATKLAYHKLTELEDGKSEN